MQYRVLRTVVDGEQSPAGDIPANTYHLVHYPQDNLIAWTDARFEVCPLDIQEQLEIAHCPGIGPILRKLESTSDDISVEALADLCGAGAYDVYRYFHDHRDHDPRSPADRSKELGHLSKDLAVRVATELLNWRVTPQSREIGEAHYMISEGLDVALTVNAICAPRWIAVNSTISRDGIHNLAPYSCSQFIAYKEPVYTFGAQGYNEERGWQDTVQNILDTKNFVVNLATYNWREQMNKTAISAPPWFDEFEYAGLTKGNSSTGWPPFVVESPVHMYCEFLDVTELPAAAPDRKNIEVRGKIVRTDILRSVVRQDGSVDTLKLDPIERLGGPTGYVRVAKGDEFHMVRPRWPDDAEEQKP